jgi:Cu/Ag efflux protein CusF
MAQKPVTQTEAVTVTATIEAIDHDNRLVTLKDSTGVLDVVVAGPEVKRFDELKVGDKVTFRYYESMLYAIRPAGQAAPVATGQPTLTRGTGPKPSGTLAQQLTASVVVTALDATIPSVTVKTDDGKTLSFKVEDKKNIEGVKVGDRVDITYTRALAVSVESPK